VGDLVRVVTIFAGQAAAHLGYVANVATADPALLGESGEPYLTVIFLSKPDRDLLGGGNWAGAFTRTAPVHHFSSDAVKSGRQGTFWVDIIAQQDVIDGFELESINLALGQVGRALSDQVSGSYDAEVQRKQASGAGLGPVEDADVRARDASATGVSNAPRANQHLQAGQQSGQVVGGQTPAPNVRTGVEHQPAGQAQTTPSLAPGTAATTGEAAADAPPPMH
jgi:hypothetical protein